MRRLRLRVGVAVALVAALLLGAAVGSRLPADGGEPGVDGAPVEGCTTIDEPGRYALVADVTDSGRDTCVEIRASDVVFDGRNHELDGVGAFGTAGVVVSGGEERRTNVTVRNVTVSEWDDGLRYVRVSGGTISGSSAADNRVGISVLRTDGVTVAENEARSNRLRGISLLESGAGNDLTGNVVVDNDRFGIHLAEAGVRNTTLRDNTASRNEFGIVLVGARGNVIRGNVADGNRIAGVWLSAAPGNAVANNDLSDGFYGIYLSDRANDNAVTNNTATGNEVGIRLRASDGNVISNNVVRASGDTAVLLLSSDDNELAGNAGSTNARGIVLRRSEGNRLENNSVSTNWRPVRVAGRSTVAGDPRPARIAGPAVARERGVHTVARPYRNP